MITYLMIGLVMIILILHLLTNKKKHLKIKKKLVNNRQIINKRINKKPLKYYHFKGRYKKVPSINSLKLK